MKSFKSWLVLFVCIAALLALKHFFFPAPETDAPGSGPPQKPPAPVRVKVARFDTLSDDIFVNGTLSGFESINIQPEVQGKVISIHFEEGERVSRGKVLLKLNDAELRANLMKFKAQAAIAKEKVQRLEKLTEIKGVSKEEYESALNLLRSLEADQAYTEALIQKTEITAPFDGQMGLRYVSPGSMVTTSTLIASLEQTNLLKLDMSVPEKYANLLSAGSVLKFRVEQSEEIFQAVVYAADPRIDPATRSLKLRAKCDNPRGILRPGSFARVELKLRQKPNVIMLPSEAIVPDMKGAKVFIVKNGESQPVQVVTGIRTAREVEILSGISAGDSVIVSGVMQLKPAQKVKVIP